MPCSSWEKGNDLEAVFQKIIFEAISIRRSAVRCLELSSIYAQSINSDWIGGGITVEAVLRIVLTQ